MSSYEVGTIPCYYPLYSLRLREVRQVKLAQMASQCQESDSNAGSLAPESTLLATTLPGLITKPLWFHSCSFGSTFSCVSIFFPTHSLWADYQRLMWA